MIKEAFTWTYKNLQSQSAEKNTAIRSLKEEIETAKENGFVIVYGCSDDLMEFEGAIQDEGGCFGGGRVYFNKTEVCQDETDRSAFDNYSNCITALWCEIGGIEKCLKVLIRN